MKQRSTEYPLVLGYGAFAVRELLGQVEPSLLLGRSAWCGAVVGFDSGDFVLIGELTNGGLKPIDPNAKHPEVPIEPVLDGLRSSDEKKVFRALIEVQRLRERAPATPELLRIATWTMSGYAEQR